MKRMVTSSSSRYVDTLKNGKMHIDYYTIIQHLDDMSYDLSGLVNEYDDPQIVDDLYAENVVEELEELIAVIETKRSKLNTLISRTKSSVKVD